MDCSHSYHRANGFKWLLREWVCCGNLWQLLLSKRFPERYDWRPVCPNCGTLGVV